jgi:hypothetical protein
MTQMTRTEHIRNYLNSHSLNVSPQKVVDYLEQEGIKVTIHHVGMVKRSMRGYSIMNRKPNASGKSGRNTQTICKSQEIRTFLENSENKDASFVVESLKSKNIIVSKKLVYSVKHHMRKQTRSELAAKKRIQKQIEIEQCIVAKNLLRLSNGDVEIAKKSVEIVARILGS